MQVVIVGGGIGGLTLALMLHARGIPCQIYEASPKNRELGVGINVLPHAIAELDQLGLLARLDEVAIRTRELIYANRFGQEIRREPRGLKAGYQVPQFSIHRGRLQGVLHHAVIERLGRGAVHMGQVLTAFAQGEGGVRARFTKRADGSRTTAEGDILIGCDGIHSAVRRRLYPGEPGLKWNGVLMWRGATTAKGFLDGHSMIVAGGFDNKLVLYPIAPARNGRQLINWVVTYRMGDGSKPPPRREDWNRLGTLEELMPHVARFSTPHVDLVKLVKRAPAFYEYPMADRDPLPRWTHGRVTLLGDCRPSHVSRWLERRQPGDPRRALSGGSAGIERARPRRPCRLRGRAAAEDGGDRGQQSQGWAGGRDRRGGAARTQRFRRNR